MKSTIILLIGGLTLLDLSGCHGRMGAPSGSGNNPAAAAVAGVAGIVDAAGSNKEAQQKAKQESVNEYLEKSAKK